MAPSEGRFLHLNYQLNRDENSRLICGRYTPQRLLGRGGIAQIYLCRDILTETDIALKIPLDRSPETIEAIKSEFIFGVTHRHPSLVNPTSLISDSGLPVMVMPYLIGETPLNGDPFFNTHPACLVDQTIAAILEIASFIHFSGYIYNDFKPSNFIFKRLPDGDGKSTLSPRLLDFNLISGIGEGLVRKGTIEYAAPEVLLGQLATPVSDYYSVGATLYELFTGKPPHISADAPSLIKQITENGEIDFGLTPEKYREGLRFLLSRQPENRPQDLFTAARLLKVEDFFTEIYQRNFGYYFSAGHPPFAEDLKKTAMDYINGRPEKALHIRGLTQNYADLDFLTAALIASGMKVERLKADFDENAASKILETVLSENNSNSPYRTVVLVEDFAALSAENQRGLRSLLRLPKWHPVIISGGRWKRLDFPCQVFDPVIEHSRTLAAKEVVNAYLKKEPKCDLEEFAEATGGEPEQIYHILRSNAGTGNGDILSETINAGEALWFISEIEDAVGEALSFLNEGQLNILGFLSAWGNGIPMVLLAGLNTELREIVDSLVDLKFLKIEMEHLVFSSGNMRKFVYDRLPAEIRTRHHSFWAETADKYLSEEDGFQEMLAYHWGLSGNARAGYDANLAIAQKLFKNGELSRAAQFAATLLDLADSGGGSIALALMLSADIAKQAGDYQSARAKYVKLLRYLHGIGDDRLMAETLKDLGDLYRSQKRPAKALANIRRALRLFEKLADSQGMADCHNNIGLILWVGQEFEKALSSFFAALEINRSLDNFREQANISSNIGIIKDILGKTSEAFAFFESGYLNAQKSGDPRLESRTANNFGYFHARQNNLSKAAHYFGEALRISEKIGYTESVINCLSNLGICSLKAGDLFASIDYNQRAQQMAEEIGNRHLALDAKLYLAEACILMGNFALSDKVLRSMENDPVYLENKQSACQIDLLRARLHISLERYSDGLELAIKVREYATSVSDQHLRLEASLVEVTAISNLDNENSLESISEVVTEAGKLGLFDIADLASLILGRIYLGEGKLQSAENWLERILARPGQPRRLLMEASVGLGILRFLQKKYDEAISILMENEAHSAGSGFLPLALESAISLAEVYQYCGKPQKATDSLSRVSAYLQQIASSLPSFIPQRNFPDRIVSRVLKLQKQLSDTVYAGSRGDRP
jgi:serine/threonine protein kinase